MSTPVIGISCYREQAKSGVWDTDSVFMPWNNVQGFLDAGATVVMLPPQPAGPDAVAAVLDSLDGLVVGGGADLDPSHYGQERHPELDEPRPDRDAWELALARGAAERDLPYFGICRGTQVLNVSRGGTLIQHLPDVIGNNLHSGDEDQFASMEVTTVPGTKVAKLHPQRSEVPVYHHQAVGDVGEGLVVAARSKYEVIEALEDPGAAFCVGVQWHPEQDSRPELFEAFVAAARDYKAAKGR
mgnify:FL=1